MKNLLRRLLGDRGERAAAKFLKSLGYRIIAYQYRNEFGEIDLIALDGRQIVFVEVKTRSSTQAGRPFEAIDAAKQRQLTKLAVVWLRQHRRMQQTARFDVVSIVWNTAGGEPEIQHFINAFEAAGNDPFGC